MCWMLAAVVVHAQETFHVNGVPDSRPGLYALTNATIYQDYQTVIPDATLIIEDGKVKAIGASVTVPKGATVVDLDGKYIYPAVVEPFGDYGLPEPGKPAGWGGKPQYESKKEGAFGWNEAIRSEFRAAEVLETKSKSASELRKIGVGAVNSFVADGIHRGTSVFVNLSDEPVQNAVLKSDASAHFSFSKGSSKQQYPNSLMGSVALIRQTYYDAQWYKEQGKKVQTNLSLEAFNNTQSLPQIFDASGNKLRVLLADKVGDEFGVQYIIKGNGDEYQRLNEIKATSASLIVPLSFPDAYDVADPLSALDVSLADMKHWELAPANAMMLSDKGVEFSFTTSDLKNKGDFWSNVRKAVTYGLPQSAALKALTYTPAKQLKAQDKVGALNPGMVANLFVASGDIFDDQSKIQQTWVQGQKFEFGHLNPADYAGKYEFKLDGNTYAMEISGEPGSQKAELIINDSTKTNLNFKVKNNEVTIKFGLEGQDADVRLAGWIDSESISGNGQLADGSWANWTAIKTGDLEVEEKKEEEKEEAKAPELGDVIYPFIAYGWSEAPKQETLLIQNATVWTLEGDGKIEGADVLVKGGKIAAVGKGLSADGAKVIDAKGKHLTPGIIDEHSHIALFSVNEGSNAITAECRMQDAVDSDDINIYRQLSGGVTMSHLLHGSANPAGAQSALIKLRWGEDPKGLLVAGADPTIKFALGENVKQSNWGDDNTIRFPQTRMGVEQVYMDGFTRAKEYGEALAKYNGLSRKMKSKTPAPRRDLQLETLLEIINKERFITCHSYVQSEINMLMKVADKFDFTVNTFTHILEGYKVADKMAEHGAGGSTFADWWAYKFEVKDAIPYNAKLMSMAGVTTAINSDDAEMARRLNQEAAKSAKYGGMDEIEILKMVTLNPAKLLHLDDQVGTIKVGKDADLVLWNDHPLSIYAKSEMTMVDGKIYYSTEKDMAARKALSDERARLVNKMLDAKNGGARTQKPRKKEQHLFDCEDVIYEGATLND